MSETATTEVSRVSEGLYRDILTGILSGDYPPETTLPTETRLSQDYGVSRSVVRSALEGLKRDGLVASRQGSGTVVAAFDPAKIAGLNHTGQMPELRDCYACRFAIEPEIAATVAAQMSGAATEYLYMQLQALGDQDTPEVLGRSGIYADDVEFHIRLAELSGNRFFATIMGSMRPYILFGMNYVKSLPKVSQDDHTRLGRQEHIAIITAALDQNPDRAREAMRLHIANGSARIFGSGTPVLC